MTRGKLRKIRRENHKLAHALRRGVPLAGAMLAGTGVALAQQTDEGGIDEVVVTALKTEQSMQDVPLSIQAIGEEQLSQLQVSEFGDYVKFLPNVSYQTYGPGLARPYMRGVASGENANHSGPLPSVGVYLDEQPITTIQGPLDVQVYDIARVEVLAGPQGTLYGASSQAGTIRIITNKPDPGGFDAGFNVTGSMLESDFGHTEQGFLNIPLGERAAVRIVAWNKHEPGYIDNVLSDRVFPTSGIAVDNSDRLEDNYNSYDKTGARAALRIDLSDNWPTRPPPRPTRPRCPRPTSRRSTRNRWRLFRFRIRSRAMPPRLRPSSRARRPLTPLPRGTMPAGSTWTSRAARRLT
jgi:outer membrane receptor protein involved in Fe transport